MEDIFDLRFTLPMPGETKEVLLNGTQALFMAQLLRRLVDESYELNTAGLMTGYRGSPLAGVDLLAEKLRDRYLAPAHVAFLSAINEEMAVTVAAGTQMLDDPRYRSRYDGVAALLYMKHPGVDRASDAGMHLNRSGISRWGGVVWASGDDPASTSSTYASTSKPIFKAMQMPILAPSSITEVVDLLVTGWALSRYAGLCVGIELPASVLDSSEIVTIDPMRYRDIISPAYRSGVDPKHLRFAAGFDPLGAEERLLGLKLPAATDFATANRLNRMLVDIDEPHLVIVTVGKARRDVFEAFRLLGIDPRRAGIAVYHIANPWPLDRRSFVPQMLRAGNVLIVEEKPGFVESELLSGLYRTAWDQRGLPRVVGHAEPGDRANGFPEWGELRPTQVARVIAGYLVPGDSVSVERVAMVDALERRFADMRFTKSDRKPHYCSGCPHLSSTPIPEGSVAQAGIGCHVMEIVHAHRHADFTGAMGGEGAHWVGIQRFADIPHGFQHMGDGTYFHSGILAIRQALAAKARITYKILYNDAVAMTGGQKVDGEFTVPKLVAQLAAEGVHEIVVASDDVAKYDRSEFPRTVTFRDRSEMIAVQEELAQYPGVSAIVYDQTCAAEKRRRRKKGTYPKPAKRVFINAAVCEGCGDCSRVSDCLSVVPIETPFGRKRAVDQSACNGDYRCLNGFCPSFVTLLGDARPKKRAPLPQERLPEGDIPLPHVLPIRDGASYDIVIAGIGGTGVLTVEQILATAAWRCGLRVITLAMTGLSQKFGAVRSHVRFARRTELIPSPSVPYGSVDLVLGCDIIGTSAPQTLALVRPGVTVAVVSDHESPPAEFLRDPDYDFRSEERKERIAEALGGDDRVMYIDPQHTTKHLFGNETFANMLLVGYAFQKGHVPLPLSAIEEAIRLNGEAVEANLSAFFYGRWMAHDEPGFIGATALPPATVPSAHHTAIAKRVAALAAYQDGAYANFYSDLVNLVETKEEQIKPGSRALTVAVAENLYRVMAYKDEYEVARLFTDGSFERQLAEEFEGDYRLTFHLAPPLLDRFARKDREGRPAKRAFGPWLLRVFRLLAKFKFLRGTLFDPFGHATERKEERAFAEWYLGLVNEVIANMTVENFDRAVSLCRLPEKVRGYGPIKARARTEALLRAAEHLAAFRGAANGAPTDTPPRRRLPDIPIVSRFR